MTGSPPFPRPDTYWRLAFLLLCVWIVAFSLSPFEFALSRESLPGRVRSMLWLGKFGGPGVAAVHFAGFAAAGFAAARIRRSTGRDVPFKLHLAAVAACAVLEAVKLGIPERHPLLIDLLVKSAGVCIGLELGRRVAFSPDRAIRWGRLAAGGVMLSSFTAWWFIGFLPLWHGVRLDWRPDFKLVAGNEITGERPWNGIIREISIFDHGAGENGGEPALRYVFPEGEDMPVVPTGRLAGDPALVMERVVAGNGADCFATAGPASPLTRAILRSGAFRVVVRLETDDLTQRGPARIVSLSNDTGRRNFTVGQVMDRIDFRVANGANGPVGVKHAASVKAMAPGPAEIAVTYDHGCSAVEVDGKPVPGATDLREPWYYLPVDAAGLPARLMVLALFVVTFGAPALVLTGRPVLAAAVCLAAGGLPFLVCCAAGGPLNPFLPLALGGAVAVLVPASAAWLVRRPGVRMASSQGGGGATPWKNERGPKVDLSAIQ